MAAGWFSEKGNLLMSFECSQDSRLETSRTKAKVKKRMSGHDVAVLFTAF